MFGGNGSQVFGDTWTWDGVTWTQQHPLASPPARTDAAMAYDAARQQVVLFAGLDSDQLVRLDDTWTWDGSTWTRQAPPYRPSNRYRHAMAYDAGRRQVVLFGGVNLVKDFADTLDVGRVLLDEAAAGLITDASSCIGNGLRRGAANDPSVRRLSEPVPERLQRHVDMGRFNVGRGERHANSLGPQLGQHGI
jgi:hypothetical protein